MSLIVTFALSGLCFIAPFACMDDATSKFPDRDAEAPYEMGYPLPETEPDPNAVSPPGLGKYAVPHYLTFSQIVNYASRTYRWTHDEALRVSQTNALAIRRDPVVMDALRTRQIPVAQLPWHIECENDQDQRQSEGVNYLTDIVKNIPRFQQLKMHLLEAEWFGRYGVQVAYSWDYSAGKKRLLVRDFKPINGDKLVFKFSGAAGVLVHATYPGTWQVTDRGRAHFFTPAEREQIIIHRHEPEDADFFEPELGGGISGVGIRSRIYWLWYLRSQVTAFLMDYLERVGAGGLTIYYYEAGNLRSLNEVQTAAQVQWRNNALLMPRYRDGSSGGPGVEVVQASTAGAQLMQALITDYFDNTIRRYILGQSQAADAAGAGLGSGISDFLEGNLGRYIKYDAVNLAETLTEDLVHVLQKYSPFADLPPFRFVFDVDKPNASELLQAAEAFYEMGGSIDEDQLRGIIGLEKPQPGHAMLAKMGAMSPAAAGAVPEGVPMLGQPGPEAGGADQGQPGMEQMPPGMAGQPLMMGKRGRRLRFSRQDFVKAVNEHFPDAEPWPYGKNKLIVRLPNHDVFLEHNPARESVELDFRHAGNGRSDLAGDEWQPRKTVQSGSLDFAKHLVGFLPILARHGLNLGYRADEHHTKAYRRLLKRLGWRHVVNTELGPGFYRDVWMPPEGSPSPGVVQRLARKGKRIRYSEEAFNESVRQHFPESTSQGGHYHVINVPPDRRVYLKYHPHLNMVRMDFGFSNPDIQAGQGVFDPMKKVQAGSKDFASRLKNFVGGLGQQGIGLMYTADPHHTAAYRRLLKRLGWRHVEGTPLGTEGWHRDLWRPSNSGPAQRLARRGKRIRYSEEAFNDAVREHFPESTSHGGRQHAVDVPPGRRVLLRYDPDQNMVRMDFGFSNLKTQEMFQPLPRVQAGSKDFADRLRRFIGGIGQRGLGLMYTADRHHTAAYRRLLKKLGWRQVYGLPLDSRESHGDLWRPPPPSTNSNPVQRSSRKGKKIRYSVRAFNQTVRRHFPRSDFQGGTEHEIDVPPDRRVYLSYRPRENEARMHFAFRNPDMLAGQSAGRPRQEVQAGSKDFADRLRRYVNDLGRQGIRLSYVADARQAAVYRRLLRRLGWRHAEEEHLTGRHGTGNAYRDVWHPPNNPEEAQSGFRLPTLPSSTDSDADQEEEENRDPEDVFDEVVRQHFPESTSQNDRRRVFNVPPDRRVFLEYHPDHNAVQMDFAFANPNTQGGQGAFDPLKKVQAGSKDFMDRLRGFVRAIGERGFGLGYLADSHHTAAYRRLLRRLGWRHVEGTPLDSEEWHRDLWRPPQDTNEESS